MTNATLFTIAHKVAKSIKAADATLHYTLCFKEALRMIRVAIEKAVANGERLGYTVGSASREEHALHVAFEFNQIVARKAKAEAFAQRFVVKTIVRETEKAVLAKCQQQEGTVEDQQWIPKKCISENGVVADWFLNKNLPAFFQFV